MSRDVKSLLVLTIGCTLAGAIFGFGTNVFSFRSAYEGLGREPLIQTASTFVYLALALILVFKGAWKGVLAALFMVAGVTAISWAFFPLALGLAGVSDPAGYAGRFASFPRPSYEDWAVFDIAFVGISAALAQGLRLIVNVNPKSPRDE